MDGKDNAAAVEHCRKVIDTYKSCLDDLVNVNSLFTMAVFVGLSVAVPSQLRSLENSDACHADLTHAKRLVVCEVVSFSCFLMSSLVAKSLKVSLQIRLEESFHFGERLRFSRWLMLLLSVSGSFLGYLFLMLSMVYFIQIRLGKLSCASHYTETAVGSMISFVSIAMGIYVYIVVTALRNTLRGRTEDRGNTDQRRA